MIAFKRQVIAGAAIAACLFSPFAPAFAASSHTVDAARFVDDIGARAVAVLDDTEESSERRDTRLRTIFAEAFSMHTMAKAVVKRSWRRADTVERERFYKLFGVFMLDNTVRLLDRHEPDSFEVTKTRKVNEDQVVVTTDVTRFGIPIAQIDWVVRGAKPGFRIVDIVLNRVSTVRTYQAEFGSVIRRKGFNGLLSVLQAKTAM